MAGCTTERASTSVVKVASAMDSSTAARRLNQLVSNASMTAANSPTATNCTTGRIQPGRAARGDCGCLEVIKLSFGYWLTIGQPLLEPKVPAAGFASVGVLGAPTDLVGASGVHDDSADLKRSRGAFGLLGTSG